MFSKSMQMLLLMVAVMGLSARCSINIGNWSSPDVWIEETRHFEVTSHLFQRASLQDP